MLVLKRKIGQKIIINGEITVVLLEIRGNRVKIGITAPRKLGIRRPDAVKGPKRSKCRDQRSQTH